MQWQYKFKTSKPVIHDGLKELMIDFAKLHVKAALVSASNCATILEDGKDIGQNYILEAYNTTHVDIVFSISSDSILNAYNLDEIK